MSYSPKIAVLSLSIAVFLTACGKQDEATTTTKKIPEAPDAAMKTIITEIADGNGAILWEAMPVSYQSDVNEIVQLAGTKIDAEVYDQSFAVIARLASVVDKQKAFLLSSEMGPKDPAEKEKLEQAFPSIIGLLECISTCDIASSAGLQTFEGQKFFKNTVSKIVEYGTELSKFSEDTRSLEDYRNMVISVVEANETEATLEFVLPETSANTPAETEVFTKVEGRWVPSEMASQWTAEMAKAQAQLTAITPEGMATKKPQIMGVITMLDGVLTQIEAAETQEQFDQALQGAMMPLMGLMMMGQGMGGNAPAAPAAPVAP